MSEGPTCGYCGCFLRNYSSVLGMSYWSRAMELSRFTDRWHGLCRCYLVAPQTLSGITGVSGSPI